MEELGKHKQPYRGIVIPFLIMIALPIGSYFFLSWIISRNHEITKQITDMCIGFAGIIGVCFDLLVVGFGFIGDLLRALVHRIKETLEYYRPFEKGSWSYYFSLFIRDGGPILWIFIILILITAGVASYGLVNWLTTI